MTIQNNFDSDILVYYYKSDDTIYLSAISESLIKAGDKGEYSDDSFQHIKISIRDGKTVFDPQIVEPGKIFEMNGDYILFPNKDFKIAELELKEEDLIKKKIKSYEFFDARGNNHTTKRTVTSKFQTAYSQSDSINQTFSHSMTWSVNGEVGGWIGGKDDGAGVNGKISVGFQDKIENSMTKNYQKTLQETFEKSTTDEYTFQPGSLYAVEAVWEVALRKGKMRYLDQEINFAVIKAANGSLTRVQSFLSSANMSEEMKKHFDYLN